MSKTRLLLFGVMIFGLMSFTAGGNERTDGLSSRQVLGMYTDTTLEKATSDKDQGSSSASATTTAAIKTNNLQTGFNDLFITGSNGVKLNSRAVGFVQDYMEKNSSKLEKMKSWGRPYFNMIDGILLKHGLPKELKYLAVIESELKPSAVSWAGAVGPWQLMPGTARVLGLKVNKRIDERVDYHKSTHAAAKYLKDLYNEFGDWLLVIAAYNGGPGNVYSAIRRSGSRNFWKLQYYLPAESRTHVKKFIGTHYIFEGQGGLTTLTKQEATEQLGASAILLRQLTREELENIESLNISGKYHSTVIAKVVLMEVDEFNRYNPEFDRLMANSSVYELKLPAEKMSLFVANKYQILNESVQLLLSGATAETAPAVKPVVAKSKAQ
ncbi:MAG TPA: lytic transglycosylase domain-containing protein [Chitinophagaceae bacterium]|nr:lytic transglycosylase domain-containing protein [Chitinophagaceae bacterium]